MIRQPPCSTLFPTRRSSDLLFAVSTFLLMGFGLKPYESTVIGLWIAGIAFFIRQVMRYVKNEPDRKSTRLNSSHMSISYAVFCLKKKNTTIKHSSHG